MLADKRPLRGRPTWVSGTKLVFLGQYADDWQKATDTGLAAAGVFYTKVAKRFIKKYGWHFDRWTDKVCPDPDPATIDEDDSQDGLSNEEIEKRHEYYREIRSLIMAWFHSHYSKVDRDNYTLEMEQLLTDLKDGLPKAPRRMCMTQFYSKHYYNTRIKPVFDAEWAAANADPNAKPSRINILNSITSRLWESETPTFRAYLEGKRNEEHAKELEEHNRVVKELQTAATTAESYHSALNNAAVFLQPLADLLSKKYGAAVSILMVLPVGSNDGEIELRSVHSGVTEELIPKTWPVFDHEGFDGAQRSMVNFGKHVYSIRARRARVLCNDAGCSATSDDIATPDDPDDRSFSSADPPTSGGLNPTSNQGTSRNGSPERPLTSSGPTTSGGPDAIPSEQSASNDTSNGPNAIRTGSPERPLTSSGPTTSGGPDAIRTCSPSTSSGPTTSGGPDAIRTGSPERRSTSSGPTTSGGPDTIPNEQSARNDSPKPPSPSVLAAHQLSSSPSNTELVNCIDNIPSHSKGIYESVLKDAHSWGPVWSKCVLTFLEYEKAAGFTLEDSRLPPSRLRPSQVSDWFKNGRKSSGQGWDSCCEGDGDTFGEGWRAWWSDIQPRTRERDGNGALSRNQVDIDWACLCKAGSSGMLLVLVTLSWWRTRLGQAEALSSLADWEDAVNDVAWVLGYLKDAVNKSSMVSQRKRKGIIVLEGSRKTRRKS